MMLLRSEPSPPAYLARRAWPNSRRTHQAVCKPLKACEFEVANPDGPAFTLSLQSTPAAAEVYQVTLKKPLGLTLTEKSGSILVDDVVPNGHAAQAGVAAGDVLLATTAKAQVPDAAPGVTQTVLLQSADQSFKTVTAALRSNTCSQCRITLVLQKEGKAPR